MTNEKIESLIAQMTVDEKISLLAGADWWHTIPIKRLNIPVFKVSDGPVDARGSNFVSGPKSACFPCGTALAATWNPDLVEQVGSALAEDAQAKGAHILLAPTVNIQRSPLAGRNFECYSEDPYLTARMAVAYITGLQSGGVGACIKHFVCNDSEFERMSMSSQVDERPLREIYLRPFEIAIREAKPWAVMSSYNRINGAYASENDYLLRDILKGEWGFDGIVISDWYGTYSPQVATGGLDLEMPGPARWMGKPARDAYTRGALTDKQLDDKVRRLLRTFERAGVFEHPDLQPEQAIDQPAHRAIARQAASEAIVLLKNDRAILPLDPARRRSIAVIGANAKWASYRGEGSARVNPHYVIAPLDAIAHRAGDRASFAIGCNIRKQPPVFDESSLTAPLTVQYYANRNLSGELVYAETVRKLEMFWFNDTVPGVELENLSARITGAFKVADNGTYEIGMWSTCASRLFVDGALIVNQWDDPERQGERVKLGAVELRAGQTYQLQVECVGQKNALWLRLRAGCMAQTPADSMEQAIALAARSDVAIVFTGLTAEWEGEGYDRPDMGLPGDQAKLIEQVAAANSNTMVVLNAGSPVNMPWLDKVAAVVECWYLGQETGNAIADVLFGDVNPSGKLPTTFPKRLQDNPAYINYPGENGKVLYGEALFVGYRYYDKKDIEPLFPFGYGLSYTTFAYRHLKLSQSEYAAGEPIRFSIEIENTGKRAGQEIVQVYVRDVAARLVRPEKELKQFAKVALKPGEIQTLNLTLDEQSLAYYDPSAKQWIVEPGEFQIVVGSSSRDIRASAIFSVTHTPSETRKE